MSHKKSKSSYKKSVPVPDNSQFLTVAQPSPDDLLSIKQAAAILNVSVKTVQRLCASHRIAFVVITPDCYRIRRSAISYFLAKAEVRGKAA